jgi:two-component system, sensor histidine kinase and response regulator
MTRILVIDDETLLSDEVVEWLILEGYEVFSAADGIAGVNEVFRRQPDLIICDITMPQLDGHGVLLELRANPSTATIPFIFVTARASHDDVRKGMSLGADDYITKPFTRMELLQAVQARLEKIALQQQQRQNEVEQWQQAFEQERNQRLLKSKLVAMFSHDFRNPLTTIMSSVAMLRDYADRMDEQRRIIHLNRAEASARQLLQMLDDMLLVSQMEMGNLDLRTERLNISELLQGIVNEFQSIYGETCSLNFESQFADDVIADPRLLHQIAVNLISNAIKYSPQGSEVQVFLERIGDQVGISVRDHGMGIPEADQQRLFTPFQRASNVGNVRGTGLGLAIIKQAVDLHSGSIELESRVGVGTTVTVKIPV